jgi:argininosuccinate lyase
MVIYAIEKGKALSEFTMEEFKNCSPVIEDDIYEAIDLKTCVDGRNITGGPAKEAVMFSIANGENFLSSL